MPGDATQPPGINVFSRVLYQLSYLAAGRPSAAAQDRAPRMLPAQGPPERSRESGVRTAGNGAPRYFPTASQAWR
jgi:hypothetical protein